MKTTVLALSLGTLVFSLVATGCYTQVGSTRDDRFSGEYPDNSAVTEESPAVDDSSQSAPDPYFDENGVPRERFYLGYYPPMGVSIGYGWYDPWYYNPWYNDPFWCWNSYYYYSPWWYSSCWYYPPYGWYGGYYGGYYCDPGHHYATTRSFGNTRGSGSTRGIAGSTRGGYETPGRTAPMSLDLPGAVRQGSGTRQQRTVKASPRAESGANAGRSRETVRKGAAAGDKSRQATRPAPRRPLRAAQGSPAPPSYNPGSGSQSGGSRGGGSASPPASRPSGNGGGSRGSGSTRGGGGGGSSSGGGRR
jgi:hypothetical protein